MMDTNKFGKCIVPLEKVALREKKPKNIVIVYHPGFDNKN